MCIRDRTDIAKTIGFESNDEYNEIMFLREITHTINAFNEMADVVRLYSKKPKAAEQRLANLLSEVLYEDSESCLLYTSNCSCFIAFKIPTIDC